MTELLAPRPGMQCSGDLALIRDIDASDGIIDAQLMLRVKKTGNWNKPTNEAALKLLKTNMEMDGLTYLSYGDRGKAVKALQAGLNRYGMNLIIDGIFGVSTQAALVAFQVRNGLIVDAVANEDDFAVLFK